MEKLIKQSCLLKNLEADKHHADATLLISASQALNSRDYFIPIKVPRSTNLKMAVIKKEKDSIFSTNWSLLNWPRNDCIIFSWIIKYMTEKSPVVIY